MQRVERGRFFYSLYLNYYVNDERKMKLRWKMKSFITYYYYYKVIDMKGVRV